MYNKQTKCLSYSWFPHPNQMAEGGWEKLHILYSHIKKTLFIIRLNICKWKNKSGRNSMK